MSARTRLTAFVLVFLLLYGVLQIAPDFQRWFINDLTVPLAAWAINTTGVSPVPGHANGSRLVAAGGGLNVLQGCEGLDLLCLWIAAVSAGSQLASEFVPMLKFGSSPSNRRGTRERIECASYNTTTSCLVRSRASSADSAA